MVREAGAATEFLVQGFQWWKWWNGLYFKFDKEGKEKKIFIIILRL
jgi:hypothetical protein